MSSFCETYTIQFDDIDMFGHVGNASWLTILTRTRIHFLENRGLKISDLLAQGLGAVVTRIEIDYLRPAFLSDQIEINLKFSLNESTHSDLYHEIIDKNSQKLILKSYIRIAFINRHGKQIDCPNEFIKKLCS